MRYDRAVRIAKEYLTVRKEIRKHLLAAARLKHPTIYDGETRKLHHYPSDLSEERLLALIEQSPAERGRREMAEASNGSIRLA